MEYNSALKIQLKDCESKILAFEKECYIPYNEVIQAPDRNMQLQQQLKPSSLRDLFGSVDRQKSTESQSKDYCQKLTATSMYSSAPSLLRQNVPLVIMPNEESEDKPEEEDYAIAFESPHTSLTDFVKSVTVSI